MTAIEWCLIAAAVLQLAIAVLGTQLTRILDWRPHLEAMPLLIRQVFLVHSAFISLTLVLFATWTGLIVFGNSPDGPGAPRDALARSVLLGIALFWGVRAIIQVAYYSPSLWRGQRGRTIIHVVLLVIYTGFGATYGLGAFTL
jgi:hypothetical protein